ncbi:MAG: restriction endonuclease subunit S [Propionivibrio sp.]|uniref:restriction endonuclease subunit S n=1 Tax=Propionivibrio sp. TaxID=2212460 RepID=UPI001A3ADB1B|nr:restriction endonuclease subunit S [Propionivibrio sp.]MBL8413455.1 restriction endonuclease subunit S [Propionivibrio sp.]
MNSVTSNDLWLDKMPRDWQRSRIRNVAALSPNYSGTRPASDDPCTVVPMELLSNDGAIDVTNQQPLENISTGLPLFEKGDVLFAKITPCMENGKGAFVRQLPTRYAFGSTEFHVLRAGNKVDGQFLYYATFNPIYRAYAADNMIGAAGQKRVSSRFLKDTRLFLPPLPEQQRIAAYLDASCAAIDAAVAAKRRQLETLDEIRKSAAHQVLSDGLRPGLPLKDSGIESIGRIPAHWDVKQIRYACEVNYGITLQLEKGQSVGDGVRILTVSNLTIDGNLDLEDEYYIDPAELTKADYLRRGDLLFNWRNGSQYHVGKTAFFDMEGEVAHVSFLLRIRCGRHMDPFFLRSYLGILKDAGFFSGAKDKVNKTFNSSELKRLRVVIPPRDEQTEVCAEIGRRTKECNDVKAAIETQIATLTAYRKSLIHECVTGQRRITEAEVRAIQERAAILTKEPSLPPPTA